jgi:hypothetical protein
VSVDEQLRWEAGARLWAVPAAILAAVLPLVVFAATPKPAKGKQLLDDPSKVLFLHAHRNGFLVAAVVIAIGTLLVIPPLYYLYRAARFRRSELQPMALTMLIVGPLAIGISVVADQIVLRQHADSFYAKGPAHWLQPAAHHVLTAGRVTPAAIGLAGGLAAGFALVMICLNAMRAGLLTRFMGVLGIIVGVLFALPGFAAGSPIVRVFWLGALAYLISGRWPTGLPPAWRSGRAEPWPSQQQVREQRERDRAARDEGLSPGPEATPEPAAATAPAGAAHPASKKRKRKRRR